MILFKNLFLCLLKVQKGRKFCGQVRLVKGIDRHHKRTQKDSNMDYLNCRFGTLKCRKQDLGFFRATKYIEFQTSNISKFLLKLNKS